MKQSQLFRPGFANRVFIYGLLASIAVIAFGAYFRSAFFVSIGILAAFIQFSGKFGNR